MNRKLKALGLALCAAFALSAVSASAASAVTHDFTTDNPFAELSVVDNSNQTFFATTEGSDVVECDEVDITGDAGDGNEPSVTVTPDYHGNCTAKKGGSSFKANIVENNCHYTFTGDTTQDPNTPSEETATVHIECPGESGIEVKVTAFNLNCIDVGPQTLHGVTYEEDGDDIIVRAKVHGIKSQTTGACGSEVHDDGLYLGDVTVSGAGADLGLTETE